MIYRTVIINFLVTIFFLPLSGMQISRSISDNTAAEELEQPSEAEYFPYGPSEMSHPNFYSYIDFCYKKALASCTDSTAPNAAAYTGDLSKVAPEQKVIVQLNNSLTPLMCAVAGGHKNSISYFLSTNPETINYLDPWNQTALFYSLDKDVSIIDLLLNAGALIDRGSSRLLCSLPPAVQLEFYEKIYQALRIELKIFFEEDDDFETRLKKIKEASWLCEKGPDLVTLAYILGKAEVFQKFLDAGGRFNLTDRLTFTPFMPFEVFKIHFSASERFNDLDIFEYMRLTDYGREHPLEPGTRYLKSKRKFRFALEQHVKKTMPANSQLILALLANRPLLVTKLIQQGAYPHRTDQARSVAPVVYAALASSPATVDALLTGANFTVTLVGFQHFAATNLLEKATHKFVGNAAEKTLFTPLYFAVMASNYQVLKTFKKHGFKINDAETSKYSLLHLATEHASLETIDTLLELGADPNAAAQDMRGYYEHQSVIPLCLISINSGLKHSITEVVATFFKQGTSLKKFLEKGVCEYEQESLLKNKQFLAGLKKAGINVTEHSASLLRAFMKHYFTPQDLKTLLDEGVRVDIPDDEGITAFQSVAREACIDLGLVSGVADKLAVIIDYNGSIELFNNTHKSAVGKMLVRNCLQGLIPLLRNNVSLNALCSATLEHNISGTICPEILGACNESVMTLKQCAQSPEMNPVHDCRKPLNQLYLCIDKQSEEGFGAILLQTIVIILVIGRCCR